MSIDMLFLRRRAYTAAAWVLNGMTRAVSRPLTTLRRFLAIRIAFEGRDTDIFIVTYPKAGTTILQMMLYQMTSDGRLDVGHIDAVSPWFESVLSVDPARPDGLPNPRVFKTHLPLGQLPRRGRFIYAVRNPKDSCVSYYHHMTSLHGERRSIDRFARRFIIGNLPMGSWFRHVAQSLRASRSRKVLIVSYDMLASDPARSAEAIAAFCDIPFDDDLRERVRRSCAFEFMRRHNAFFDPRLSANRPESTTFIRQGVPGTWTDDLPLDLATEIDNKTAAMMRELRPVLDQMPGESVRTIVAACGSSAQPSAATSDSTALTTSAR